MKYALISLTTFLILLLAQGASAEPEYGQMTGLVVIDQVDVNLTRGGGYSPTGKVTRLVNTKVKLSLKGQSGDQWNYVDGGETRFALAGGGRGYVHIFANLFTDASAQINSHIDIAMYAYEKNENQDKDLFGTPHASHGLQGLTSNGRLRLKGPVAIAQDGRQFYLEANVTEINFTKN